MFFKAFSIFSSLGIIATAPFVFLRQNKLSSSFQVLSVNQKKQQDLKNNKNLAVNFFTKYFENINKNIASCKSDNSTTCSLLFYLEDEAENEQAILEVIKPFFLKNYESNNVRDSDIGKASHESLTKSEANIVDILSENLKKKVSYLKEISSIKLLDFDKLSINLLNGEEKTIPFNIQRQFEDLAGLKNYCKSMASQENNLICSALNEEVNVLSTIREVIYR